ncbi:MAG: flavin reductase family protein [Alphaproteobacteria bacterium]
MINQKAMFSLTHGMYIIGAKDEDRFVGSCVDAIMQGAIKPMLLNLSCLNNGYTQSIIKKTGMVSISVLGKKVEPSMISTFGFQSSRNVNKWDGLDMIEKDNLPFLNNSISHLTCKVIKNDIYESHSIFTLEVLKAEMINENDEPLTYTDYQNYFKNEVIKGLQK